MLKIYELTNKYTWSTEYVLGDSEEDAINNRNFSENDDGFLVEALDEITVQECDNIISLINEGAHESYSGYYYAHWEDIEYGDYLGNYGIIYQVGEYVLFLREL